MGDEEGALEQNGYIVTKSKEVGGEVDEINVELDAGKNPFQEIKGLKFWSKNFGPENESILRDLPSFDVVFFTSYTMIGKHSSTALHTLLTEHEQVQSINEIGICVVFAFGGASQIKVEPGSHRTPKIRSFATDEDSSRIKATIKLNHACVKGPTEIIALDDGGRLLIDPRLNFCILEGKGMMFIYRKSVVERPPMSFPVGLEEFITRLETDKFKIHAEFSKRIEPAAPEAG
ncbi:hypothetical protein EV356DRAFT_510885 [Viridothelium virens]|uniref:Uncharacterized protein n=1 Tax=Viridothelium virens TaxID=1048519 RepID=A0A6A6GV22_VIRVR|nr:hypothetical protein EV356DRAFT_510885 [Viridothelium virens]